MTGFGPFLDVARNPSLELARALAAEPPPGLRVVAGELPVSVARVPAAYAELVQAAGAPLALLALGVHRGAELRLERRARFRLSSARPDCDGVLVAGIELAPRRDLETAVDLESCRAALAGASSLPVCVSEDAGGYVCERAYHSLLATAEALAVPGLFLHVPPVEAAQPSEVLPAVRALAATLAEEARRSR